MMFRSDSNTSKFSLSYYVTMAMLIFSISSHVKDKNSIFTARDEDFSVNEKILVFHYHVNLSPLCIILFLFICFFIEYNFAKFLSFSSVQSGETPRLKSFFEFD